MKKNPFIIFGSVILFAFHLSSPGLRAEDGANLIPNPGFEDAPDASASYFLFTSPDSQADNCRFTISTDTFHSGKQSALMQADDFARFCLSPQGSFPVAAGDCYRVGVWVKAGADFQMQPDSPGVVIRLNMTAGTPPVGSGSDFIYLDNTVSQGQPPYSSPLPASASAPTEWTHIEAVVQVPAGVDSVVPTLFFWKAKGSLYVDDFSFQKVDPTTPVTPMVTGTSSPGTQAQASQTLPIPTQAEIDAIAAMLPADPQGVGRPITDRAAWALAAQQPAFQRKEKIAATFLTQPTPELTDALFNDVQVTGRLDTYLVPFRLRSTRLIAFVVAECIENQGKYLPAIESELDAILKEKSWAAPGSVLSPWPDHSFGGMESIDLSTAARAWTLATTDYWLGDKLKPETRQRLRDEMKRRVFDHYEDAVKTGKPHWFWMTAKYNWNAVCTSGVTGAALEMLPDPKERALFIASAQASMNTYYLPSFPEDGFDAEGLGYWSYGFGSYLCLSETIYEATQGKINMFAGAKIRQIALFPRHFEIMDGIFPAFGDSGVVRSQGIENAVDSALLLFINQRWGMGWTDLDPAKNNMYATHPGGDRLFGLGIFGFPLPTYGSGVVVGSPPAPDETAQGNLRFFFKPESVLITRSERPGAPRLGLALKGGNNGGNHGHNDNGTYVAVCNGAALIVDPGMESYTAKSFGPHRYENMFNNSYGHDVPFVGDTLEKFGPSALGKIISTTFTDDKDTLVMDLTTSYPVPSLQKLTRTYVLDRTKPSIEITDEASFSEPTNFGSALVTVWDWKEESPGVFLFSHEKSAVRATVTVDDGTIVDKPEPIIGFLPPGDPLLYGLKPERLGVNLADPVTHVVMHTLIIPATVSP
ncbi:MAG: heparinase II/III family protein [Methylacidiphilales bacterium]|nr:heparinase II/III family protein [Candidatus Methylacidiphilales bacterium]